MRPIDRDLIRGGHYGQRSCEPRSEAEHMAAPTNAALVQKVLANPEPFSNRISIVKSSLLVLITRPGGHGSLRGRR
jgi:hypothetical protein